MSGGDEEQEAVPCGTWQHLSATQPVAEGRGGEVRGATLRLLSGEEELCLEAQQQLVLLRPVMPLAEALVLQALAGVTGVPRLYGVTGTFPRVLVMSWCPGTSVRELWYRGEVRACLTALLRLCPILTEVHARRVCHRELRGGHNILTDGTACVHLIDFSCGRRHAERQEIEAAEDQVQRLARDILMIDMDKAFDPDIYKRRDEALGCLGGSLRLPELSCVLRRLLSLPHNT